MEKIDLNRMAELLNNFTLDSDNNTNSKNESEIEFLDLIDEDEIPQVSDVTLILSQYVAAMESYREFHYGWNGSEQDWFIKNT